MKAIIIDDETDSREQIKALLCEHCKQVEVLGEAGNAAKGAKLIIETKPDLVLLDVQMPGQSGFDMLTSLGLYDFEVIFITGHDDYTIQAIRCSALDYILKPVGVNELVNAVTRAERKIKDLGSARQIENLVHTISHLDKLEHKIALPVAKGYRFINPYNIVYTESSNSYTTFILSDKEKIMISKGLYQFEEILAGFGFIRCHASHMVNRLFVKKFYKVIGGHELLLSNGVKIPVTPMYVPVVKQALRLK